MILNQKVTEQLPADENSQEPIMSVSKILANKCSETYLCKKAKNTHLEILTLLTQYTIHVKI